jgi:hypothetical protein
MNGELSPLTSFILPGGSEAASGCISPAPWRAAPSAP